MLDEFKELLSILNARGVRYLVVGDFAVGDMNGHLEKSWWPLSVASVDR